MHAFKPHLQPLHTFLVVRYANLAVSCAESDFTLRTVVTEHQQLQLWVELHVPVLDAVTAVVYFTLKENHDIQQDVTTHSVLTENTIMVFQLESYEIPDDFQNEDFLVQVALQVGITKGSVVPSSLQEASTASKELIIVSHVHKLGAIEY